MNTLESHLFPGLVAGTYVTVPTHRLAAADARRPIGPNIGRNGVDLTIAFLSLNRPAISIRLLTSIWDKLPWFRGHVLIVDQGSTADSLAKIRDACKHLNTRWKIVELGRNYGVAGGRNRTIPHVETNWVMFLDNDMIFIADPINQLQADIAMLGCHFMNMPLLDGDRRKVFARGGHLYLRAQDGELHVGGGTCCRQEPFDGDEGLPFLSTFLLGGASVMNKHTFLQVGGFDEEMFIGFEDIDFSLRLFQQGYKIGNARSMALVHDHPPPADDEDREYERQRHKRDILKRSADHIYAKHGMLVWTHFVDEWLEARHRELGLGEPPARAPEMLSAPTTVPATPSGKPRVALVVDSVGWAFWNISQQIVRHLGDRFDFRVHIMTDCENAAQVFFGASECDIVHVFWREFVSNLRTEHCKSYIQAMGIPYEFFLERIIRPRVLSTCIYDHLFLEERELAERLPVYRDLVDAYYVGSNRLRKIYEAAPGFPPPLAVLPDGVDLDLFYPKNLERFDDVGRREVVVGWTGNSEWGGIENDFKGVNRILKPAVEKLRAEGLPVRLLIQDRALGQKLPHHEMVNYYAQLDVYACTSKIEGTPNPILESMACGVPCISTDVGVVPEAFGPRQHEFILAERSPERLEAALRRLIAQPALFRELSAENLESIRPWSWTEKTRGFGDYFQRCLERKKSRPAT